METAHANAARRNGVNMSTAPATDVLIVGAGIIGIACAARLAETGRRVTVIDRTGICEETSSGNAAALAFSDLLPLAHKGMLRNLPGWLMDPLGPLSIPPAYLPKLAPWLVRFLLAGNPRAFDHAVSAQAALMALSESQWMALMDRSGTSGFLREDGCLELYDSERSFAAARPTYDLRERYGIEFRHLSRAEMQDFQPGLSPDFAAGTFVPRWKTVAEPAEFGKAVWAHAERKGARLAAGEVKAVAGIDGGAEVTLADGRRYRAGHLVIAAGAWSHRLAGQLRDRIPLETERGYNTTLPPGAFDLRLQLFFADHGFVATPLSTGVRIGGAVELGGLKRRANYKRARAMLKKAQRFLPGLKAEGGREWMGYRPSLPDSLPVIGRSSASPRILYAFGHGHLGLTQAAATGHLILELVGEQSPSIDLSPFDPRRF